LVLDCHRMSLSLNDLERQNKGFCGFFGNFKRIVPKPIETDIEKLHMKFSAFNVDFSGSSHDFLGLRKLTHKGVKERYPRKSHYFTIVGQSFMKTVADRHGHATLHNKH